ncbi:tyrosine-type recombinase/integrase [Tardiphaga sp. P9-11]|uniref:tyrosine-type recombinase/integrase n=1 Tax=Tardiphaga sp. P9-11 TaxID=2024614 RepID=UPI0011F0CB21|nr:tyrosine-type recombinase/integrase [Tardiphaga sp. P9-11]KAA0073980.1 hypothetical protein CIW50_18755 [Tardiphaga sp. P9-11]
MTDHDCLRPEPPPTIDDIEIGIPTFVVLNAKAKQPPFNRPLLIIRTPDGRVDVPREPAAWALDLLESKIQNVHAALRTIGRLYQFSTIAYSQIPLTADDLQMVVWNYVAFRVGDRIDELDMETPQWLPVRRKTAETEFSTIIDYLRFCHRRYETIPLIPLRGRLKTFPDFTVLGKRDFFIHLRGQRERWRKLMGAAPHAKPLVVERANPLPRRSSAGQTMPRDEVDLIISAERNPAFKALWILLAYGGIRVSEALNLWCCDVMPGTMISEFANGDTQKAPLVVLADPADSRFTGIFDDTSLRRIDYLAKKYGLIPRSHYPPKHPLRAGWKSMLETNVALRASWVYWSFRQPSHVFLQEIVKTLAMRRHMTAAQQHPYLFINLTDRKMLGEPQKYSNLTKAFDRACRRVGLEPHLSGRHIHGLRHYYKETLKNVLKLPAEFIQVMMHHKSISSQQDYSGGHTTEMREALESAYARVDKE